jgi:integrase
LHIEHALVEAGGVLIEKDTKTHAERRMSLDERTMEVLTGHREMLQSLLDTADVRLSDGAFVFSHEPDGTQPWRPSYVTLAFSRLAKQRGLDGLWLHDLRHFAATTMLVNGVDVRTAAGRLGHANTSTTLDVYSHFVKAADQLAGGAVASVLDG